MRKLFVFWRLCLTIIAGIIFFIIQLPIYFILGFFILFFGNEVMEILGKFSNDANFLIDKKIKEIIKNEENILNKDLHERCMNGEYGLLLRRLYWTKEIIITILLFCFVLFTI